MPFSEPTERLGLLLAETRAIAAVAAA